MSRSTTFTGFIASLIPAWAGWACTTSIHKLIDDPAIDPTAPEALVYAPERDGTLRLAALEYLVPKKAWNAHHAGRPQLFTGKPFNLTAAPNRYGLPTFYSQHVWAWKTNPAGLLTMFNPTVHCPRPQ